MKRKILSGLVGVAMLGAAASANAFLFSSTSDLNGTALAVGSLNQGASGFTMGLTLKAGDAINIDVFPEAYSLYATGSLGLEYNPGHAGLDFVRNYSNLEAFHGVANTLSITGPTPDVLTFGDAVAKGGTISIGYNGIFDDFPLLGVSGPGAGVLNILWSYNGANQLTMNITESGLMGWAGFEQALSELSRSLTGSYQNNFGALAWMGATPMAVGGAPLAPTDTTTFKVTAVPEPASLALLGIGIAGLGFMRRRKA